jgi:hypothetical protein
MSERDKQAFPMPGFTRTERTLEGDIILNIPHSNGLTKREYFAGQALFAHLWVNQGHNHENPKLAENIAMDAVACADALIKELGKRCDPEKKESSTPAE